MADDEKPVHFELKLVSISGRLNAGQVASTPQESDPNVARKRRSQEELRVLADGYKEEALLTYVHLMRTSPDERIKLQAADRILNRAVGMAKALSEEEKKGADAGSILDVLAAMSKTQGAIERQAPGAPSLEHDAENPDDNFEKLMRDVKADESPVDDDVEDGELV